MLQSNLQAVKENLSRFMRTKRTGSACRHSFPQWSIEIFNCCSEEEVNHSLRADFAHYLPDTKILILGLENNHEHFGTEFKTGQIACQIRHKRRGQLFGLQQLRLSQQFARALKWDVEQLSLCAVQKQIPKLFARNSLLKVLTLENDAITNNRDTRLDDWQSELICEDSSIRTARLTIEVIVQDDCLITTIIIDELISEERRTTEHPPLSKEHIRMIKNLLG